MKLTQEQKTAERIKFYDWWDSQKFPVEATGHDFNVWIACRESNNEIELPPRIETSGEISWAYDDAIGDCIESLQSQGYTIKSTGVNAMQHNADEALGKQLEVYAKPADHNLIAIFNIRAEAEAETERKIEPYREAHAEQIAEENAKLISEADHAN